MRVADDSPAKVISFLARMVHHLIAILKGCTFRLSGSSPTQLLSSLIQAWRACTALVLPAIFLSHSARDHVYNILWILVFAFATLNILSLGVRRLDRHAGLSFGEVVAIMVVVVSIILLAWEMLYVFHVLPIQLSPQ